MPCIHSKRRLRCASGQDAAERASPFTGRLRQVLHCRRDNWLFDSPPRDSAELSDYCGVIRKMNLFGASRGAKQNCCLRVTFLPACTENARYRCGHCSPLYAIRRFRSAGFPASVSFGLAATGNKQVPAAVIAKARIIDSHPCSCGSSDPDTLGQMAHVPAAGVSGCVVFGRSIWQPACSESQ
jgi:hypothetical protein